MLLFTVSIGIYLRVLYALQLDDDILFVAKEDPIGKGLQDLQLKQRERATKKVYSVSKSCWYMQTSTGLMTLNLL